MSGLTKRHIDDARRAPSREIRLWDTDPRGFGVRIKTTGVATFFVQYTRPDSGRKTRYTLGQYGRLTLDEARKEARKVLGSVAKGGDPAGERQAQQLQAKLTARTVAELCDLYLKDADVGRVTYRGRPKKASTLAIDRGRVVRHIKPLLGARLVTDITRADVEAFFHAVRQGKTAATIKTGPRGLARVAGGPATAARTVGLLGSLFSYAIRIGLRADNPVAGFERPPARRRDRALNPEEYRKLGAALDDLAAEGARSSAVAAIRTLALTGARRSEILTLKWDQVDTHRQVLRLAETKTGQQLRAIGRAALEAPGRITCAGGQLLRVSGRARARPHCRCEIIPVGRQAQRTQRCQRPHLASQLCQHGSRSRLFGDDHRWAAWTPPSLGNQPLRPSRRPEPDLGCGRRCTRHCQLSQWQPAKRNRHAFPARRDSDIVTSLAIAREHAG
jgi:integrase